MPIIRTPDKLPPDDTPDFEPETLPLVSVFALAAAVLVLVFGAGVMVGGWG